MKNIKSFRKFNEELSPEAVDLFWQSKILGALGYLATFGISYFVFSLMKNKSDDSSVGETKKVIKKLQNNDGFQSLLSKVLNDESVKNLLSGYKEKLENRTITFNEMKRLGEMMKEKLGDILTVDEWQLCDDLIDNILNSKKQTDISTSNDSSFSNFESNLLNKNGFTQCDNLNPGILVSGTIFPIIPFERRFTNPELKIDIIKHKGIFFYYESLPKWYASSVRRSTNFNSIEDCLNDIKSNRKS